MLLAFKLSDLVTVPFGFLLNVLYGLTQNYGIAMILFAVLVQLVLLPITAKSKKSMMKMSRLTPRQQEIQAKYADDPQRQNEAIRQLYQDEGVSMGGGCLWSIVPMLILIPLFTVIRQPITYILMETPEVAQQIVDIIKAGAGELFSSNTYYDQVTAAQLIPQFASQLSAQIPGLSAETLAGINFNFLGINIGAIPSFAFWSWSAYDWAHIGAFLVPVLSAGSQVLSTWIMQKLNESVITDKNGVQDEETAKKSQTAQTTQTMMWMMPLMSLWIGFTVSGALSVYWFVSGMARLVIDVFQTKHYRKIYDAEDAVRIRKAQEAERLEAEKERLRAERRAANPEGITANTSKKKLQKQQRDQEQAAKAAAAREYASKKGILEDEAQQTDAPSGIASRPYCKGRSYDPDRYANTEE
ncbi:MAG: membrane protein insertase YidC [Eubacteriales bacterium]|nr:membrane protein insertase YidC [Eubacteriales bacterium]